MNRRIALATLLATSPALAGPHKVLVLPLDGNADPATRTRLDAQVGKLAHAIPGQVSNGNATFSETASAVGCDPSQPKCADDVLATLSVDEIVWGTATTQDGQTVVVVHRATKGAPVQEATVTLGAQDSPDRAETGIGPLFGVTPAPGATTTATTTTTTTSTGSDAQITKTAAPVDRRDRNLGLGLGVGGGVALVVGLALWAEESSYQNQINNQRTNTAADILQLTQLEDKAASYAFWGNVMVLVGAGVGIAGGYFLWRDHKAHVTVSPVRPEQGTGATVTLGGTW